MYYDKYIKRACDICPVTSVILRCYNFSVNIVSFDVGES